MKQVRLAYISLIQSVTGLDCYDQSIPIDLQPLPDTYVLITTDNKNETSPGKPSISDLTAFNCTEINYATTVDIVSVSEKGFVSNVVVEDIETAIVNAIKTMLSVPGIMVKNTVLVNSQPLPVETPTSTVQRKVLSFQHWLSWK